VKKKKKIDYLKQIEASFQFLRTQESIYDDFNFDDYDCYGLNQKKRLIYKTYSECFGSGSRGNLTNLYRLGIFYRNFGDVSNTYIFNEKYKDENMSSEDKRRKKSEIAKNLIAAERFRTFSEMLNAGVYQLSDIPVTYFVKIKKDDWHMFMVELK